MDARQEVRSRLSLQETIRLQRQFRSTLRYDLHCKIFKQSPNTNPLLLVLPEEYKDLKYRSEVIIADLTVKQKIVNGGELYHYTTLSNLTSISDHRAIYGNRYLTINSIPFNENCMSVCDLQQGDINVVCCCPGQVDPLAYRINNEMKVDVCRLAIDINKLEPSQAIHNQFFKLCDFSLDYTYQFKISELNVICKYSLSAGINVTLSLDNQYHIQVNIPREDTIYYGDILKINRYCALQLFTILSKIEDSTLKNTYYQYLANLNDSDLRMLIVVFAQNLTLFSEYNFNVCLPLENIRINEILVLGEAKVKLQLRDMTDSEYEHALMLMRHSAYEDLAAWCGVLVDDNHTITQQGKVINLFGHSIHFGSGKLSYDFSNLNAAEFASDAYVETRCGVGPELASLMKKTENRSSAFCSIF